MTCAYILLYIAIATLIYDIVLHYIQMRRISRVELQKEILSYQIDNIREDVLELKNKIKDLKWTITN